MIDVVIDRNTCAGVRLLKETNRTQQHPSWVEEVATAVVIYSRKRITRCQLTKAATPYRLFDLALRVAHLNGFTYATQAVDKYVKENII